MDTFSHGAWGFLFAQTLAAGSSVASPVSDPAFVPLTCAFSLAPDLCADIPLACALLFRDCPVRSGRVSWAIGDIRRRLSHDVPGAFPAWFRNLYYLLHSPVFVIIGACILWPLRSSLGAAFVLGWGAHLVIDAPTHRGEFAMRPLYPILRRPLPGFVEWRRSKSFNLVNYALLIAAYGLLWRPALP